MYLLDWADIANAAKHENEAFTTNQLIGHALILLKRGIFEPSSLTLNSSKHPGKQLEDALCVIDTLWKKHLRTRPDNDASIIRSINSALSLAEGYFQAGGYPDPAEIVAERDFNRAGKRIRNAEGHFRMGEFSLRYREEISQAQINSDKITVSRDKARLKIFESQDPYEWLSLSDVDDHRRSYWEAAAEVWLGLHKSIAHSVSPEDVIY
ncbi:hypothetical protein VDR63_20895 [Xanthomonas campestris pv. campestris]|uniref:hypothetical protein n=1 Tax=Xanthomonas campestris TaxID=339 RepID=UPI002B3EB4DD|nr:hypothetical protein [Xanthomonas campestris pv. campestris]WVL67938.1 hypothetical protein VDR24_015895 [Xanthomonas campestris pv. campestris]